MAGVAAHRTSLPSLTARQADREDGHGIGAGGCHVRGAFHEQSDVAAIADGRREHPADENAIDDCDRRPEFPGLVHLQRAAPWMAHAGGIRSQVATDTLLCLGAEQHGTGGRALCRGSAFGEGESVYRTEVAATEFVQRYRQCRAADVLERSLVSGARAWG